MYQYKKIYRLLEGIKKQFLFATLATFAVALFSAIRPVIIRITVDSVIGNEPLDAPFYIQGIISLFGVDHIKNNLWIPAVSIVILAIFSGICMFIRNYTSRKGAETMRVTLRDKMYDHIQKLPYGYHVKAQTGDLIQRCTVDINTIWRFFAFHFTEAMRSIFLVLIGIPLMLGLHVQLTLVSIFIIPAIFLLAFVFFKKIRKAFQLVDEKEGELSSILQENLSGIRVVRAFGRQAFENDKYGTRNKEVQSLRQKLIGMEAIYWGMSDFFGFLQLGIIIFYGVHLVRIGELTSGTLLQFYTLVSMIIWPIRQLGRILSDFGRMQVSIERINEVLYTPKEQDDAKNLQPDLHGDIVFKGVDFSYVENTPILKNMSFTVKKGETVAILGSTGSGKSTIMHLLLRLYDHHIGHISINNIPITDIEKNYLRRKIGIVLQEPFLYSRSILENLFMAKNNLSMESIIEATTIANIHEVIMAFEHEYDTQIGERGVSLSGGQQQRVAIARTLLKEADILIFDDSLSAVDTGTDLQIRKALAQKQADTTTFIVSQRITTLMGADKIMVMEDGKISHMGTHNKLITVEGLYKRIWDIQGALETDFLMEEVNVNHGQKEVTSDGI